MNEKFFDLLLGIDPYMSIKRARDLFSAAASALGTEAGPDPVVVYLLGQKRKIHAIKHYRDAHRNEDGTVPGLRDAKDAVDEIERQVFRLFNDSSVSHEPAPY